MSSVCTSWRETLALKEAGAEDVEVLQDSDLEVLYNQTNFLILFEKTRWYMVLFLFRTGLRPESLEWVLVESMAIHKEDRVRYVQVVLGTMKNLPSSLAKVDAALFKQRVVECLDTRFCALDAYTKLCDMLPTKSGPLVRSMSYTSKEVGEESAGYSMFRGVAKWAGKVLDRPKMVPKDIGWRAVITKLVHAGLEPAEIAKYIGVHERTVAIYHRAH